MNKFYKYFTLSCGILVLILLFYCGLIEYYQVTLVKRLDIVYKHDFQTSVEAKKSYKPFLPIAKIPKNKPVRILILEGGGLSGIISSEILVYLENKSGKPISKLFDIIGGTSIGALQAATLTVPDVMNKPKYSATDMLSIIENSANKVLKINLINFVLSGFGLYAPLFDTTSYTNLLIEYFGDIQLSQLLTNVLITGYDSNSHQVMFFKSRKSETNQKNFLLNSLIGGVTAIPDIMPPQRIANIASINNESYDISDASFIINNPIIATLLYADSLYPENEKIIVFLGLGLDQKEHKSQFITPHLHIVDRLNMYYDMRWAHDKLLLSYLDTFGKLNIFGLSQKRVFFIDEILDSGYGNELMPSKNNITYFKMIGNKIITTHKKELDNLIELLTSH